MPVCLHLRACVCTLTFLCSVPVCFCICVHSACVDMHACLLVHEVWVHVDMRVWLCSVARFSWVAVTISQRICFVFISCYLNRFSVISCLDFLLTGKNMLRGAWRERVSLISTSQQWNKVRT